MVGFRAIAYAQVGSKFSDIRHCELPIASGTFVCKGELPIEFSRDIGVTLHFGEQPVVVTS
jgi:hypothetical protein